MNYSIIGDKGVALCVLPLDVYEAISTAVHFNPGGIKLPGNALDLGECVDRIEAALDRYGVTFGETPC